MTPYQKDVYDSALMVGPCNREVCKGLVQGIYDFVGKKAPTKILFAPSPMAAQVIINHLMFNDPDNAKLNFIGSDDHDNDLLVESLLQNPCKIQNIITPITYARGNFDSEAIYWHHLIQLHPSLFSDELKKQTQLFYTLTKCSGIWFTFDELIIFCDRAEKILLEDNELHCENGPAIAYKYGWNGFYTDGHRSTRKIVLAPDTITIKEIQKCRNAELRRLMLSAYGVSKYAMETDAQIIDVDHLGLEGSSIRTLIQIDDQKWLIGSDGSTGRVYHMPVANEAMTCREAHESISGISETQLFGEC